MAFNKSIYYKYTLKTIESYMICLYKSTILDDIKLYKCIMQSFYGFGVT